MIDIRHRRILSGALIALLSMAILAPLLAATPEANLPECCRVHGKHHCMMAETGSALREYCPSFPKTILKGVLNDSTPAQRETTSVALVRHVAAVPQTEAIYRESFSHSRQERGPPSLTVS